jgi:small GTP-binding protein
MLNGKKVRLQIWDTAGQERFQTILPAYYRGADGIALVYDVTDASTFGNVAKWIKQIEQHAPDRVQKILIGNKADMSNERVITTEQGQELGKTYDAPFFECSAKAGINITESFETLITNVITKAPPKPVKDPALVLDGSSGGIGDDKSKCSNCAK